MSTRFSVGGVYFFRHLAPPTGSETVGDPRESYLNRLHGDDGKHRHGFRSSVEPPVASKVENLFILGRYPWIMLSFILCGFQSPLVQVTFQVEIARNCRSASVLMWSWQFLAF